MLMFILHNNLMEFRNY